MHAPLITEQYRELQRDLHARTDYGRGVDAETCAFLIRAIADRGASVLDYGCGQGHLGRLLVGDYDVREYDPAIPGRDAEPEIADFTVCADVLEHIEPDCLDTVLAHLRDITNQRLVLVIATGPAGKTLADGRNAHLIIRDSGWWHGKLSDFLDVLAIEDRPGRGVLAVCSPLRSIGRIQSSAAVSDDVRNEQVRQNVARVAGRLVDRRTENGAYLATNRKAVLACYGPSLQRTWPEIKMAAFGDPLADVISVSGAHRFLIDRGVIPYAHIDCDPREHKVKNVGAPHLGVRYWLASCVHPAWFDLLAGHHVALWHSYNGEASRVAFDIEPGCRMVAGGGSVGLRAISLLYTQGYRHFDIHGMDCSFVDGDDHAGEHAAIRKEDTVRVQCRGRWFETRSVLILYARYFLKQVRSLPDATFTLHGDGLLQHMHRQE